MKVIKPRSVDAAIRTLSIDERQKVFAWIDHLENWENDEHLRKMSKLTTEENVYVLNTSDDIRIFFTVNAQEHSIAIVDIAKPSRFENVPARSER